MSRLRTLADVRLEDYEFLDFGAGVGASLARFEKRFGGRGLGIEINEEKAAEAQGMGLQVVHGNVLSLPGRPCVRYVTMDNVLEHLPSLEDTFEVLAVAALVAREFLYIRHPSFEDEAYLQALGLKQFWADWTGHPSHILLSHFAAMFRRLGLGMWEVRFLEPVFDSRVPSILPFAAPRDQHHYSAELHGPKPDVRFAKPVYGAIDIYVPVSAAGNTLLLSDYAERDDTSDTRPSLGSPSPTAFGPGALRQYEERLADLEKQYADSRMEILRLRRRRSLRAANALGRCLRARSPVELGRGLRDLLAVFGTRIA